MFPSSWDLGSFLFLPFSLCPLKALCSSTVTFKRVLVIDMLFHQGFCSFPFSLGSRYDQMPMITIVQSTACCVTGIRDIKPCVLEYLLACPEPWPSRRQSTSRWVITPVTRFRTSMKVPAIPYPSPPSCHLFLSQRPSKELSLSLTEWVEECSSTWKGHQ